MRNRETLGYSGESELFLMSNGDHGFFRNIRSWTLEPWTLTLKGERGPLK